MRSEDVIGRRIVGITGSLNAAGQWLDADVELDDGTVLKIGYIGDLRTSATILEGAVGAVSDVRRFEEEVEA